MSANFHRLYYRPTPGAGVQVIRISGDKCPGDVNAEVQKRLFYIAPEAMRRMELHALAVLAGRK